MREREGPIPTSEFLDMHRRMPPKLCLHPDAGPSTCSGSPIRAHTVQEAGLRRIAEDGHVYTFHSDPAKAMAALIRHKGKIVAEKIGVNQSSTFTGFCSKHDAEIFAPIEQHPFRVCAEHTFLLAYRALCREFHAKLAMVQNRDNLAQLDRGKPAPRQRDFQKFVRELCSEDSSGYKDAKALKECYDDILRRKDFADVRYYVIRFDTCPDILCSGGKFPSVDFAGRTLQDLGDLSVELEGIYLNIITADTGGAAVFSWVEQNGASQRFIESLASLGDDDIPHALVRFVFEFLENKYWRISWWDSLRQSHRDQLERRTAVAVDLMQQRSRDCLADDGLRLVNWKVVGKESNLPL